MENNKQDYANISVNHFLNKWKKNLKHNSVQQ